jgi:hypothetical protein
VRPGGAPSTPQGRGVEVVSDATSLCLTRARGDSFDKVVFTTAPSGTGTLLRASVASVLVLVLASSVAGCKEKNTEALEHLRPDFTTKRTQLASLAAKMPAPGAVSRSTLPGSLSPPITHDAKGKGPINTEIVMAAQLTDPDVQLHSPEQVDLLMGDELLMCLMWTGPKNPMASSTLAARNGESLEKGCRAALAYRYLVALRPAGYTRPVAVDERNYTAGALVLEGSLFDLSTSALIGSFRVTATSADKVTYLARKNENKEERLESFAYSSLWDSARDGVAKALAPLASGRVTTQ